MPIYTLNSRNLTRGLLVPTEEIIFDTIRRGGNEKFDMLGKGALGMPVVSCELRPLDYPIYGIKWMTPVIKS
jgi:hypothetical protein